MKKEIVAALSSGGALSEKKLKKAVFATLDAAEHDDEVFNDTVNKLVSKGKISLADGKYSASYLASESGKDKRKRTESDAAEEEEQQPSKSKKTAKATTDSKPSAKEAKIETAASSKFKVEELWKNGEKYWRDGSFDPEYLRTNPDRVTRLFCGNLNKKVTEEELKTRLPGIIYIKWITDKQTGEFYGSSFLEMKDPASAALAVLQDKTKFLGRPLKLYYCPPKPGDKWPPQHIGRNMDNPNINPESSSAHTMNRNGGKGNEPPRREKMEKPEGCRKLFAGNLSYNIDDATIVDFFKECGELTGLRWLTRQGTEEFRGAGYVEFATTEEADKAMALDGKGLLGRNVRLDWTN